MEWNRQHRERLYWILERQWSDLDTDSFENWLKDFGIEWAELKDEIHDSPQGTVAIWEGPGFADQNLKQCWVIPEDVAEKFLVLGVP